MPDTTPTVIRSSRTPGDQDRQRGWDLTFLPIKDFSIKLAATHDRAERESLKGCLTEAVRETFADIEREAATTRRGHGGGVREPVGLVAFTVFHYGNRSDEPLAHGHLVVTNTGFRTDGTTGSIDSKPFYDRQKEFGARFDERLAEKLRDFGVRVERTEKGFILPEVPRSLVDALSSRRKEVEAELARRGVKGPKAAEATTKATRKKKEQNPTLGELPWCPVPTVRGRPAGYHTRRSSGMQAVDRRTRSWTTQPRRICRGSAASSRRAPTAAGVGRGT